MFPQVLQDFQGNSNRNWSARVGSRLVPASLFPVTILTKRGVTLTQLPTAVHLVTTFSRGHTYSSVIDVIWRPDDSFVGVISARGTGHVFGLKSRVMKEPGRAVGQVKIDGGINDWIFLRRRPISNTERTRRRSSATKEVPELLTITKTEKITS
jgi:hypothetical protein